MTINAQLARRVAAKLTEKLETIANELEKEYVQELARVYNETIPLQVIECHKLYPEYFQMTNCLRVKTNTGTEHVDLDNGVEVICNFQENSDALVKLNLPIYKTARALNKKWNTARSDYQKTKNQLAITLERLRTYKEVIKAFPQAAPFLPEQAQRHVPQAPVEVKKLASKLKKLETL